MRVLVKLIFTSSLALSLGACAHRDSPFCGQKADNSKAVRSKSTLITKIEGDAVRVADYLGAELLSTRPIFHKLDETIRGHVFCSFLALVLKAELEARIAALGRNGSWPAIIADIDALTETEVDQDGKQFMLRSTPRIAAGLALRAAGVALPPTVQAITAD